ncbi:hypothetical protein M3197_03375 [Sporosarcina aquimarina]|nr:hypothetical protein [Sporosarcina aquimarina]MCM3756518.1 hypothetical protein [Sporosarcina aquimarina]
MTLLTTPEAVVIIAGGILLAIFSFGMGRGSNQKKTADPTRLAVSLQ